jgi:hypothetical protein
MAQGRKALRLVDVLAALDIGLVVAALNLRLLSLAAPTDYERLLMLKTFFSRMIGAARGWSAYEIDQDPIGMWIQLAIVAVVSGVPALILARRKQPVDAAGTLYPGLISVLAPWMVWLVGFDLDQVHPTEAMHWVVLGAILVAPVLGCVSVLLLHRGELRGRGGVVVGGLLCSVVLWHTLVARELSTFARAIAYTSLVVSLCAFFAWLRDQAPFMDEPGVDLS